MIYVKKRKTNFPKFISRIWRRNSDEGKGKEKSEELQEYDTLTPNKFISENAGKDLSEENTLESS